MLITNFAAGELSKTLFGRVDLPQYYRGAARMENFDVMPTGGVRRRSGTQRLREMEEGDGRIIPFIVNRDLGFLLHLTPLKITVHKIVKGEIPADEPPLVFDCGYMDADEIADVQHAQNYDTMVLCHENHPPLEARLENGFVSIRTLQMDFDTQVVAGANVTDQDKAGPGNDPGEYKPEGWLAADNNYPSAVSFYNGRLIFAATINDRQRIFASDIKKAGKNYNFSTYKIFLTEKREYSTLFGKIEKSDTSIIYCDSQYIINSFSKPPEQYYVDSQLYPPDTRIEDINLNRVKLTRGMKTPGIIPDIERIRREIEAKRTAHNNHNNNPAPFTVYTREWKIDYLDLLNDTAYETRYESSVKCVVHASILEVIYSVRRYDYYGRGTGWTDPAVQKWTKSFSEKAAEAIENGTSSHTNEILNKINDYISWDKAVQRPAFVHYFYYDRVNEDENLKTEAIERLYSNIRSTMYYELSTSYGVEKFYNYPGQILADVMARIVNTDKTYIGLYTREIIADEYPTPDCGFTFEIASDANDAIRWLAVNKGLIAGTETGEWIIPPDVHATNIQAKLNSRYGSDRIQGAAVGDATCFFQTGKKGLVEYYIPQQDSNFRANNMAMLAPEMLSESPAREFDYANSPHAKLLITRTDGAMATLLYERGTGTFAWGRITTGGQIRSAAVLPGPDGNDDAYLLVRRGGHFYLERLREDGGVYLDSWTKADAESWGAARELYEGEGIRACRICETADGAIKHEALDAGAAPDFARGGDFYIGHAYKSVLRTMPVLANSQMKKNNIVNLVFRFLESGAVKMTSILNGRVSGTNPVRDMDGPYTGVKKAAFPGSWAEDAQAEISADDPAPVTILALNAEMQGGQ